jgi:transcriptional regulator with XRE-family HTH domain
MVDNRGLIRGSFQLSCIHKIVGMVLRDFRLQRGKTQVELGSHLGVTFQQVQKYENGKNRISYVTLREALSFLGFTVKIFESEVAKTEATMAEITREGLI